MKTMKMTLGTVMMAVVMLAACDPTEETKTALPPPSGSMESPLCGTAGSEVLLLFDTSSRMGDASGYLQGGKSQTRQQVVVDALKRTLPHLKRQADFGLLTFPFGDRKDNRGNTIASALGSCSVPDVQVAPGDPYGWIVSQVEAIQVGGNASVAGALDRARDWFGGHAANGRTRSVVLFTAGGDQCGGDMLRAIGDLANAGIPTWILSFENSADAALLNMAADRGGRALKQDPFYRYYLLGPGNLASAVEGAVEEAYQEICDGLDNDCDGLTDEDFDADGDGWATCNNDCDDNDAGKYPGAAEGFRAAPYAAARITGWYQGHAKGGAKVADEASGVGEALDYDISEGRSRAFSLGFNGFVEVEFDCPLQNGPGADLRVYERSPAASGAEIPETAAVYAWDSGSKAWVLLGQASNADLSRRPDVKTEFDLGTLARVTRIRIVNSTPEATAEAGADGFDVNGVYSLHDCGGCDGKDNNCNGEVDEDFDVGGSCMAGVGACQAMGHLVCSADGQKVVCDAQAVQGLAETCNGIDDDCDGQVDENQDQACETECGKGHRACVAGALTACVVDRPNAELCNDKDDDCDGQIDEGFDVGANCLEGKNACTTTGVTVCSADGLETVCQITDSGAAEGIGESCNGLDDDCDGIVDNGKGLCPAGETCYMGACVYD